MENILRLYRLPYDEKYPVVCFDERPCFLIGDVIKGLDLKAEQVRKAHYEYEKNGSCVLLLATEPLTGKRIARVYDQRTKAEYAEFMQIVANEFPNAEKIRLIQDNLNTHNESSFYQNMVAQEAFELAQKFEFHYTPKKGSWLNAVEIDFSAIARTALKERIPSKEKLTQRINDCVIERQEKQIKIQWEFDITAARKKMNAHYSKVYNENAIYTKET
jgi:transposase